jgi:hypothetical protein
VAGGSAGTTGVVAGGGVIGSSGSAATQVVAGPGGLAGTEQVCEPGSAVTCRCEAFARGDAYCLADGSGYSECICQDPSTGGAAGTGGSEPAGSSGAGCECSEGLCCDGCHYLGPDVVCFYGSWSYCIPDAPPCGVGSYALTTIRATVFCSGLSPLCVYYPGGSERVEEPECCPRGTECQPHELVEVMPNDPPDPLPHAECI